MRVQAGLKPDDWKHWGHWTTFKRNAAELLASELRGLEVIYCSPLTDPYQPAEESQELMPGILRVIAEAVRPPLAFVIQTRGPLVVRDRALLLAAARRTRLRVSFTVTTNQEDVRRIFEPHCAPLADRWRAIACLREAGIAVTATLAPLLPCDPAELLDQALAATSGAVVADPFHVRQVKRSGATTRQPAHEICHRYGWDKWLEPPFHQQLLGDMRQRTLAAGRVFAWGPPGFGLLAQAWEQNEGDRSL